MTKKRLHCRCKEIFITIEPGEKQYLIVKARITNKSKIITVSETLPVGMILNKNDYLNHTVKTVIWLLKKNINQYYKTLKLLGLPDERIPF